MLVKAGRNAQFRNFLLPHLLQRSLDEGFGAGDIIKTVHEFANAIGDEASEVTLYSEQSLIKFTIFIKKLSNRLDACLDKTILIAAALFAVVSLICLVTDLCRGCFGFRQELACLLESSRNQSAARYVRRRRVCSRIRSIGNSRP